MSFPQGPFIVTHSTADDINEILQKINTIEQSTQDNAINFNNLDKNNDGVITMDELDNI